MFIILIIVVAFAVIAAICFMERAQRRILIQYPKRQVGNRVSQGESSHLPLKLNTSGVIAPIFASSLLLLPTIFKPAPIGRVVLVAWKATRESARALSAALPFLQSAERVILALWADPGDGEDAAGPDIELGLRRHGVNVSVHREVAPAREVGELLLSKAADVGADLLVMGCYGHGRAREWVLGGASLSRGCRCDPDHIRDVIFRFPEEERAAMADEAGIVSVDCEFCARAFPVFLR